MFHARAQSSKSPSGYASWASALGCPAFVSAWRARFGSHGSEEASITLPRKEGRFDPGAVKVIAQVQPVQRDQNRLPHGRVGKRSPIDSQFEGHCLSPELEVMANGAQAPNVQRVGDIGSYAGLSGTTAQ
jgi:hypothetical protein